MNFVNSSASLTCCNEECWYLMISIFLVILPVRSCPRSWCTPLRANKENTNCLCCLFAKSSVWLHLRKLIDWCPRLAGTETLKKSRTVKFSAISNPPALCESSEFTSCICLQLNHVLDETIDQPDYALNPPTRTIILRNRSVRTNVVHTNFTERVFYPTNDICTFGWLTYRESDCLLP